jgi:HK97 family phage major capsid protein
MPATGLGAKSIWFGDMNSFYTVRFAERLTIDVSRDFAFANDLTTYRIKQRLDGRIVDTNAARVFVGAAS